MLLTSLKMFRSSESYLIDLVF